MPVTCENREDMGALAASQGGTPAWVTPLIAGGAAILAAAVTAYASAYAARRKVAELRLSNSFELAKQYLESARNYTETVYFPLSIRIYKLHSEFLTFKAADEKQAESSKSLFANNCEVFIAAIDDLFARGATAVLTLRLDETVTRFISFLRESRISKQVETHKAFVETFLKVAISTASLAVPLVGAMSDISIGPLLELGKSTFKPTVVAAPMESEEFEKQFVLYINAIKSGIKEVTLGGYKQDE